MAQCTSCKEPNEYQDRDFLCSWCKSKGIISEPLPTPIDASSEPIFMWTEETIKLFEKKLGIKARALNDKCRLCKNMNGGHFCRTHSKPWSCPFVVAPEAPGRFVPTDSKFYDVAKTILTAYGLMKK